MNVDGSGTANLTGSAGVNVDPTIINIKGVGERILFSSNRSSPGAPWGDYFDIYSMKTDGTGLTQLTNNSLYDAFCAMFSADFYPVSPQQLSSQVPTPHPRLGLRW